ncbi:surface lipoprotein assembly modifier [Sphingomonas sp. XXL09]|uniref:surface lipoprotein assembly modifier n=1 Tax=Sphingomonas sp. XXL09 TaxID=3457787 RepID=UPI00406BB43B
MAWLLAATVCPVGAASAQTDAGPAHLGAVDVFDLAGRAAAEGRDADALKLYDALSHDPDVEVRSEALFRKGQLLAAQERWREAALAYRLLLDAKPGAARVRLELAMVLARLGDEIGARRQLRLAQAAGLPPDVAEQVSQFSRALRSPKRLGGSVELTLAPDTNVNRGTQARTLDTVIAPLLLDRDARETSGIGLRLRASGFAKQPVTDRISLIARATGSADLYRSGSTNDILATALLGIEWRGPRDQMGVTYGIGKRWYGGRAFADTYPLTGEWLHQIGRTTQLTANVSRSAIRYDRNRLQDGTLYDVSLSAEHALSAQSGIAIGGGVTRQTALDPSYASWSVGPLVYGWREWGRTTVFASATGRRLIGDERNLLFTDKRQEWFLSSRVGLIARQWSVHGLSPTVRVGFERNFSTVSIYDYQRTFAELGLSRTF